MAMLTAPAEQTLVVDVELVDLLVLRVVLVVDLLDEELVVWVRVVRLVVLGFTVRLEQLVGSVTTVEVTLT